jgi:hypothetical protein
MDDSLTRSRFSPSGIRAQLKKDFEPARAEPTPKDEQPEADAGAATPDKVDPLPRPGDAYRGHGRHGNKPELTLHFVMKDYAYEGFSYADCERVRLVRSEKPGGGPVLIVRFNCSVITEVRIEGRHLHGLYNWIGLHRVPWVWEHPSPAEFADEKAMLISRITISHVER